jgi:hypothetical protein
MDRYLFWGSSFEEWGRRKKGMEPSGSIPASRRSFPSSFPS